MSAPEIQGVDPDRLESARVRMMFRMSIFGIVAGTLIAVGLGLYFWLAHDRISAVAFIGYFLLIGLVRGVVWLTYRRADDLDTNPQSWLLAASLTMLASGLGWGSAAIFFFELDPFTTTVVVAAIGISGVLVLAPSLQVMAAFNVPLFLALLFKLVMAANSASLVTAALLVLTLATVVLHAEQMRRAVTESLAVVFEKQRLVAVLSSSKAELEQLNDKLSGEAAQRGKVEEELKAAKISADAANMAKDEFLATMSHEIRTPLNGILPILDILRGTELNETQRDYLNTAFQSSKHLLTIIDDILDYSKIEAGKLGLESVGLNLRELLDSVVRLMASTAERKGIALRVQIEPEVRLAMRGDPVRLKQVLTNLVSNAVKFTNEGSVTLTLAKRNEFPRETELLFTVRDTGIGMDKTTAERLFQPFSQADASTTRTYGGTGLGLAICKRLVEMMHGKIGVRSEQDRGSVFWFTVRLKKSLGDIDAGTREMPGSKALLATADQELARRFSGCASQWDVKLTSAVSLQDTANHIRNTQDLGASWKFDTLVLDYRLGQNVVALIRDIRRSDALTEMGILVLTDDGTLPDALDGESGVLSRPRKASETTFREAIQQLMDGATGGIADDIEERELAYETTDPTEDRIAGHVLLVEDNPVNLHVAQKLLEVAGLSFEIARNGKIALEMLTDDSDKFNAVVMDCMMPVMDGYAATQAWREHEGSLGLARKPIIAMTANAMAGDRQKCLDAGMDDYMAKPMNLALLKRTLSRWLKDAESRAPQPEAAAPAAAAPAAKAPTPSAPEPAADAVVIDHDVLDDLRSIMGSDFASLVDVYLEDSPKAFRELVKAVESGEIQALVGPSHSLKSTSANLGATGLAHLARSIEHDAREGRVDQPNKRLAAMLKLYKQVALELRRIRSEST